MNLDPSRATTAVFFLLQVMTAILSLTQVSASSSSHHPRRRLLPGNSIAQEMRDEHAKGNAKPKFTLVGEVAGTNDLYTVNVREANPAVTSETTFSEFDGPKEPVGELSHSILVADHSEEDDELNIVLISVDKKTDKVNGVVHDSQGKKMKFTQNKGQNAFAYDAPEFEPPAWSCGVTQEQEVATRRDLLETGDSQLDHEIDGHLFHDHEGHEHHGHNEHHHEHHSHVVVSLFFWGALCIPKIYTNSTLSSCECQLIEDYYICNNPRKPQNKCNNFFNKQDCEAIVSRGSRICVWRDRTNQNRLANHGKQFAQPEILEVIPGKVHVAIGFGLANAVILEGSDGIVLVDALESVEAAIALKTALTPLITTKPIKAIIYLHGHPDHIQGLNVFSPLGSGIPIYAHQASVEEYTSTSFMTGAIALRSARQFGSLLTEGPDGYINSGIGPILNFGYNGTLGYRAPTHTFVGSLNLTISGIDIELTSKPGETSDQINLYIPSLKVLVIADNFYKAFPNLYAIRGTKPRDPRFWYRSIDQVLDLSLEHVIGTHLRPIQGASNIKQILTNYRDGIQYLYDQTRSHMNKGVNLEYIAEKVKLPSYLASDPHLQEFYGEVEFHVKSIFINELGWFGGSSVDLKPLSPLSRAQRLVGLCKKINYCLENIKDSLMENTREGDQWALELSHSVLLVSPTSIRARSYKIRALTNLAIRTTSSNTRNYYLTEAEVLKGKVEEAFGLSPINSANGVLQNPVFFLLELLTIRINTTKTDNVNFNVLFRFTDTNHYTIRIRRHVAELRSWTANQAPSTWTYNLVVICPSTVFKASVLQPTNIPNFISQGALVLNPSPPIGTQLLFLFLNYFV